MPRRHYLTKRETMSRSDLETKRSHLFSFIEKRYPVSNKIDRNFLTQLNDKYFRFRILYNLSIKIYIFITKLHISRNINVTD